MKGFRDSLGFLVVPLIAALAGCSGGGGESGLTPLSAMRALAIARPGYVLPAVNPKRGSSWAKPMKRKSILLYVLNSEGVGFYDYNSGKQVGEITSVSGADGMCVDRKGDVYITEFDNGELIEFAHGGTKAINTYTDSGGYLIGCSIDGSGDVSATAFESSMDYGNICIWKAGKGSPACVDGSSGSRCYYLWPAGYDDKGNLIVEGEYSGVAVCALTPGSGALQKVTLNGATIDFPDAVMWDGKYVALGDQETGGVYQTGIYQSTLSTSSSGLTLTAVNTVVFDDTCYSDYTDLGEPFVVGKKNTPANRSEGTVVVGSNLWCYDAGKTSVEYWHYPAGGDSFKSIDGIGGGNGVAVSIGT